MTSAVDPELSDTTGEVKNNFWFSIELHELSGILIADLYVDLYVRRASHCFFVVKVNFYCRLAFEIPIYPSEAEALYYISLFMHIFF